VAGVNGGYFVVSGPNAGASTGAYQLDGHVISSGLGRSAIIFCRETNFVERTEIDVVDLDRNPAPAQPSGCQPEDIVGAGPRLVRGGRVEVTEEAFRNAATRHPRTAFAVTRRATLLLVTVDGRQASSIGLRLDELAAELVKLGAVEALNLDGGGSTTMIVRGAIRNSPSDGRERPVGDGILVFSVPSRKALLALMNRLVPTDVLGEMHALLSRGDLTAVARRIDAEDGLRLTRPAARLLREGLAGLRARSPKGF
jgi:exopolysaccharide biosynthesis protein